MPDPPRVILFQGDSITDAGRVKDDARPNSPEALGRGYAFHAAAMMLADQPDRSLAIYNRGISGHKVFQLAKRWEKDCLALKPDVLSILIGTNDYWHAFEGRYEGTLETYQADYDQLLARTREALPGTRLMVCEPFCTDTGVVTERWRAEFPAYRAAARDLARKHDTAFVPFQSVFDEAVREAAPDYWAHDGVHPTPGGHLRMARAWLEAL